MEYTQERSVGRPSTYDPAYCEQVIDFLREGYSLAAFAGSIGVARSTIYQWVDNHDDFSDAVKIGQAGAVFWWEKANRTFAQTGEGNATALIFGLKNRAPDEWRDKTETQHSGEMVIGTVARKIIQPKAAE